MSSIEEAGGLQDKINNAHTQLEQEVRSARNCAVDSLALLIKLRADLIDELEVSGGETREVLQVIVQGLGEEILCYRKAVGHIADAGAYVTAFSPQQAV